MLRGRSVQNLGLVLPWSFFRFGVGNSTGGKSQPDSFHQI